MYWLNELDDAGTAALDLSIRPAFARFYALRWVLSEGAKYVARFAAPHIGTAEDTHKWVELMRYVQ